VRETYTFDVVTSLPKSVNRSTISRNGCAAASAVHDRSVSARGSGDPGSAVPRDRATGEGTLVEGHANFNYQTVFQAFCELRGLLLLYLKKHPDQYNCRLEQDVLAVTFPRRTRLASRASWQDAFARIIELAYNHVIDCVFGELTVPCPDRPRPPAWCSARSRSRMAASSACATVRGATCGRSRHCSRCSRATLYGDGACETIEAPAQRQSMNPAAAAAPAIRRRPCCAHFTIDDRVRSRQPPRRRQERRGCGDPRLRHDSRDPAGAQIRVQPRRSEQAFRGCVHRRTLKDIKGDSVLKRVQYQTPKDARADRRSAAGPFWAASWAPEAIVSSSRSTTRAAWSTRREAPLFARLAQLERESRSFALFTRANGDGDDGGTEAKGRKKS